MTWRPPSWRRARLLPGSCRHLGDGQCFFRRQAAIFVLGRVPPGCHGNRDAWETLSTCGPASASAPVPGPSWVLASGSTLPPGSRDRPGPVRGARPRSRAPTQPRGAAGVARGRHWFGRALRACCSRAAWGRSCDAPIGNRKSPLVICARLCVFRFKCSSHLKHTHYLLLPVPGGSRKACRSYPRRLLACFCLCSCTG